MEVPPPALDLGQQLDPGGFHKEKVRRDKGEASVGFQQVCPASAPEISAKVHP